MKRPKKPNNMAPERRFIGTLIIAKVATVMIINNGMVVIKINSSTIRSINYLNVPILIRSSFGPINIHFGPQFGILTGAINEVSGIPTDIKDKFLGEYNLGNIY